MPALLLQLFFLLSANHEPLPAQQDFCELKGAVYIERQDPSFAQFSVYIEESEAFAQYLVFKEDSRTYADRPGLWYIVENRGMADFTVFITEEAGMADFSIYFTETASFADCQ